MAIRIYNTLFKEKQAFKPLQEGKVGMYVCGPTVYDSCHIGHARSVVVFDVIFRYLKAKGFEVTYVRNFTDVDDKIINRANELNIRPAELAEKYINEFYHDMDGLNVERATHEPRATEHIDPIIRVIETLMAKGMAYEVDGDVYYAVELHKVRQTVREATGGYGSRRTGQVDEKKRTRLTLPSGNRPNPESLHGTAHGGKGGPAGISNARP